MSKIFKIFFYPYIIFISFWAAYAFYEIFFADHNTPLDKALIEAGSKQLEQNPRNIKFFKIACEIHGQLMFVLNSLNFMETEPINDRVREKNFYTAQQIFLELRKVHRKYEELMELKAADQLVEIARTYEILFNEVWENLDKKFMVNSKTCHMTYGSAKLHLKRN